MVPAPTSCLRSLRAKCRRLQARGKGCIGRDASSLGLLRSSQMNRHLSSMHEPPMTMRSCSLLSLATAVPPYVVEQSEAKLHAREAFGGKKALFDRLSGVFDNAGIARRHTVAPLDWYVDGHGWHDRNAVYLEASEQLFVDAATAAIE